MGVKRLRSGSRLSVSAFFLMDSGLIAGGLFYSDF